MLSTTFERDDAGCAGFRQIDRSGGIRELLRTKGSVTAEPTLCHIIFIVVAPVGVVGNRGYAASAADGLKAVGRLAVNSF